MDQPIGSEDQPAARPDRSPQVHLRVLGTVEVARDGVPIDGLSRRRKPLAVFAYLALAESNRFTQRDHLCGIFWPESSQDRARASLRQALTVLRRFLPGVLEFRGDDEVKVKAGTVSVDLERLRAAMSAEAWHEASALDRGDPFRGFHVPGADGFEDWISALQLEIGVLRRALAGRTIDPRQIPDPGPGDSAATPALPPRERRRLAGAKVGVVGAVIVGSTAVVAAIVADPRPGSLSEQVVVSTPELLGIDGGQTELARGMQDELIAALSGLQDLSVVPAASVRLAEGEGDEGPALARALGARYHLETSIHLEGGDYRVAASYVDWAQRAVVWSETFQAPDGGLLDLRAEVRSRVSDAMGLDPRGSPLRHVGATSEAMPHYLSALGLMGMEGPEPARLARWGRAVAQLDSATNAAPEFASAWARVALLGYRQFWMGAEAERAILDAADRALARAVELHPEGPEVRLAQAHRAYHVDRDWELTSNTAGRIVREFGATPDLVFLWAMAERRRGNFDGTINILEDRLATHPLELRTHWYELFNTYQRTGRLEEAADLLEVVELTEGRWSCTARYQKEYFRARGAEALDRVVQECRARQPESFREATWFWHEFRMRRFDDALMAIDSIVLIREARGEERPGWMSQNWAQFPLDLWRGLVYQHQGRALEARAIFATHIPELERLVAEFPDLALRRRFLALAYAGAGDQERALEEIRTALSISVGEGDLWYGVPAAHEWLMLMHADMGNTDEAIDILDGVLTAGPAPFIGLHRLLQDPQLDPLRSSDRYPRVVEKLEAF